MRPTPLWTAYGRMLRMLAAASAGVVALMLGGVATDVLLRNLFVSGVNGIVEYTEFGLYLSGVLAAPWLLHEGRHIRTDFVAQFGPAPLARAVDAAADALGLAVALTIAGYALATTLESRATGAVVRRTVEIPEWWFIAPLVPVMTLLAGEFLFRLARSLAALGRGGS